MRYTKSQLIELNNYSTLRQCLWRLCWSNI